MTWVSDGALVDKCGRLGDAHSLCDNCALQAAVVVAAVAVTLVAAGPDQRQGWSRENCCDIARENDFRVMRMNDVYCL